MRKLGIVLALLLCFSFTSCAAGPHQLRRTVDNWDQELYVDSPWLNAVLWVVPVIPLADVLAAFGDFFITDAYTFWIEDAFTGQGGTGFVHAQPDQTRYMNSLLSDDGKWLRIEGGSDMSLGRSRLSLMMAPAGSLPEPRTPRAWPTLTRSLY